MKYKILKSSNINDLEKASNRAISSGWLPTGGVCSFVSPDGKQVVFMQSIYKHNKNETI